ncbi:BnaA08g03940D [Brassica napus]|uniref:BnaA08g03940D protein n=1 Tax=Brassica napus TaxID=3708 RepID=A0A078FRF1_BRANA|nr:BnaA08g03940D [Brassica napus]
MATKDEVQNDPLLQASESDGHEEFNGASFTGAVLNLATAIIGAGIMALPATMKVLGLVPGIVMILLMAFLTDKTIDFLLRFSGFGNARRSYGGLMEDSFGKTGRIVLQVAVLVTNVGVLIVYMIILLIFGICLTLVSLEGDVLEGMLEGWFGESWWDKRTIVLLFTTLCVFAPLTSFKRIDTLRFTSALSLVLAFVFLVITAGIVITKFYRGGLMKPRLYPNVTDLSSVWKLFTVVPVLVNAYICHSNVHNIQNELEDSIQMKPVVRSALMMSSSVYVMTSLFGYLLFGESTLDDVLANFDTDLKIPFGPVLSDAVRLSYAAHLMLVFPVIFYPLRVNMDGLLFPTATPSLTTSNLRFASITAALIAVIFVGANFIPSIWDAFQLTGATTSVCIGFIFPAAVILKDRHNRATKMDKTIAIFVIVLAVFSSAVAIYSDAYALVKKNKPTCSM